MLKQPAPDGAFHPSRHSRASGDDKKQMPRFASVWIGEMRQNRAGGCKVWYNMGRPVWRAWARHQFEDGVAHEGDNHERNVQMVVSHLYVRAI